MKKIIIALMFVWSACGVVLAQDYNIRMAGQSTDGYYVKVTTVLDKNQNKTALEYLKKMAVDGVMLRGVAAGSGYSSQAPLVDDPDVAKLKADFFDAFNREKMYEQFCTLENTSVTVTQLPKKKYEVSGLLVVNKERLIRYLTEHDVIKNFESLW